MSKKSFFITIEGPEGSGKSTLARYLRASMISRGFSCFLTYEPGDNSLGKYLREVLLKISHIKIESLSELFLFEADRVQHLKDIVIPALKKFQIVLSARFCDSTTAYQGYGRGLDLKFVRQLNRTASMGIAPDLTLLLDIDPKLGLPRAYRSRGYQDRIESQELRFHQRVRRGFLNLAKIHRNRFRVLDASKELKFVRQEAMHHVIEFLERQR